jgi:hypothetical protein
VRNALKARVSNTASRICPISGRVVPNSDNPEIGWAAHPPRHGLRLLFRMRAEMIQYAWVRS